MAKKKTVTAEKKERCKQKTKNPRRMKIIICLAMLTTICAIVFAVRVIRYEVDLAVSKRELAALPVLPETTEITKTPEIVWSTLSFYAEKMRGINPDYVGVIRIDSTVISYPVVRGSDNVKYLSTSFDGTENPFGALFMDYRCIGENLPHIIIYGHHAGDTDGNRYLFGWLDGFLDEQNRSEHPVITFIENNHLSEFEIFSARITDINDPAYQLNFSAPGSFESFLERNGAPPDATQIITLSTCYGAGGDKRIVIQGMRKDASTLNENQIMIAAYE